jgi:transglutaminase-like putative cysteine protease
MPNEPDFLQPGRFVDSDDPGIVDFARAATIGLDTDMDRALRLYCEVRDGILYDAYMDFADPESFRASAVLRAGRGFCVGKAALLAASARALGIPARVGYADVKNHLTSPKLRERLKSDLFIWHSYSELCLEGRWVKATPAFNAGLCERLGIAPLAFDGREDSLFQPFDTEGRRYMEYLVDRGAFADVPFRQIQADFRALYPGLADRVEGDFQAEAVAAEGTEQTMEKGHTKPDR